MIEKMHKNNLALIDFLYIVHVLYSHVSMNKSPTFKSFPTVFVCNSFTTLLPAVCGVTGCQTDLCVVVDTVDSQRAVFFFAACGL